MKFLKVLAVNAVIWFVGVMIFFYWIQYDIERNPVPADINGSIPDSFIIWVYNFAVAFFLFLVLANVGHLLARFLWRRLK